MPTLSIIPDGDGCWPDLADQGFIEVDHLTVAGLSGGMVSGRPSVALRIDLPDGRVVIVQTSLTLFLTASDALRARHGDPRREEGGASDEPLGQ